MIMPFVYNHSTKYVPSGIRLYGGFPPSYDYMPNGNLNWFSIEYIMNDAGELQFVLGTARFVKQKIESVDSLYDIFYRNTIEEFFDLIKERAQYGSYDSQIVKQFHVNSVDHSCRYHGHDTKVVLAAFDDIENRLNEAVFSASATKPLVK